VILTGDFNVLNYIWSYGTSLPDAQFCSKIKGTYSVQPPVFSISVNTTTRCQMALLDLVFTNISDLSLPISDFCMVSPDKYHPPLLIDFQLMLDYSYLLSTPRRLYGRGDYLLLYNTLLNSDCSCVYNENSVDSSFLNLTSSVSEAIKEAILFVTYRNSSFTHWFSSTLKY
jgi:hypothetical protein